MGGTFEQDFKAKEATLSKIWAGGAKAGDETAADITLSGAAANTTINFGRLSGTSNNSTIVQFRDRSNSNFAVFRGGLFCAADSGGAYPSPDASSIAQWNSTTKAIVIPRMTGVQRDAITPLSGGMIWSSLSGLCVWQGRWISLTAGLPT